MQTQYLLRLDYKNRNMTKNQIFSCLDGKIPIVGIWFKTKELANEYIRAQRRNFVNGLFILQVRDGFMVCSKNQLNSLGD